MLQLKRKSYSDHFMSLLTAIHNLKIDFSSPFVLKKSHRQSVCFSCTALVCHTSDPESDLVPPETTVRVTIFVRLRSH